MTTRTDTRRLAPEEHTGRPWRIHEIAPDFEVEDVWALPVSGGPDDFEQLLSRIGNGRPEDGASPLGRVIWAARWKLGKWFGWDDEDSLDDRATSLRERLPPDLRDAPRGPEFDQAPFDPVYQLHDEFAAEIINGTVHGVMHLSWVRGEDGNHRGQMAVLVKPNGRLGRFYMAAIKPFRHVLIYPALLRNWEREWQDLPPAQQSREGVTGGRLDCADLPSWLPATIAITPNHADLFTLPTDVGASPQTWARAIFGNTPGPGARLIWAGVLRLQLVAGASSDTISGWRIGARGSDWIRMDTRSNSLTCHLIVRTTPGAVSLATLVRYDRRLGGQLWRTLSAVHRALIPGVIRAGADQLATSDQATSDQDSTFDPVAGRPARKGTSTSATATRRVQS